MCKGPGVGLCLGPRRNGEASVAGDMSEGEGVGEDRKGAQRTGHGLVGHSETFAFTRSKPEAVRARGRESICLVIPFLCPQAPWRTDLPKT